MSLRLAAGRLEGRQVSARALMGLAVLASLGCGCGGNDDGKLKVATVDIVRVMEERPETRQFKMEWARQAGDTYIKLSDVGDKSEALALQQEIQKQSEEWQKRTNAFMDESVKLVQKQAAALAKERGVDLVVVDNPMTHTVTYSDGDDLTLDINFKLQNEN